MSVAAVALGIVSMTDPFDTQNTLVQFLGIGLILFAVLDLIAYIQVRDIAHKVKKKIQDQRDANGSIEVDYREVDDN